MKSRQVIDCFFSNAFRNLLLRKQQTFLVLLAGVFFSLSGLVFQPICFWWPQDAAFAAPASISLEVSQNVVAVGEQITLTIRLAGDVASAFERPKLPDFFDIVGESTSSSFQMIGGQVSREKTISYELAALRQGRATIGPLEVGQGSSRAVSNSIDIEIRAAPQSGASDARSNSDSDLPFSISASLDSTEVFVGQQILLSVKLSHAEGERQIQYRELRFPSMDGIKAEDLGEPQSRIENADGKRIRNVFVYKKLSPMKSGQFAIGEVMAIAEVLSPAKVPQGRNLFGSMMAPYDRTVRSAMSQPLTLNVKKLPDEGRTDKFSGLVGETSWDVRYEINGKSTLSVGESIPITVRLTSTGDLSGVAIRPPPSSPSIKVYEDASKMEASVSPGLSSVKEFRFAVVFLRPGQLAPQPLEFEYFSPESGQYQKLEYQFPSVEVTGRASSGIALEPYEQSSVNDYRDSPREGLRPLKYNPEAFEQQPVTREIWIKGIIAPSLLMLLLLVNSVSQKWLAHLPWLRERMRQCQAMQRARERVNQLGASDFEAPFASSISPELRRDAASRILDVVKQFLEERSLHHLGKQTVLEWQSRFGCKGQSSFDREKEFWDALVGLEGLVYSAGYNLMRPGSPLKDLMLSGLAQLEKRISSDKLEAGE